jgi:hypothetical protein
MPAPAAGPLQVAQTPQERMERGFQRRAGVALARRLVVAALQIGAGAEGAPRACDDQATDFGLFFLDRVQRFAEAAQHVERDRVHHFLMVELENGDRPIEIERDVLELHLFPHAFWPALFVPRCDGFNPGAIFDFPGRLVHGWVRNTGHRTRGPTRAKPSGNAPRKCS